ncbi:hypothetical protein V5O48_012156 [Marasmius crinis-equi]|uniref:Uncharacterized protein n=1 Tax=Marasmius crinis-equi TaxID=585013 RepID=A0ABR3F3K8_9AGAR
MSILSADYQGSDALVPYPSFEKPRFPVPDDAIVNRYGPMMPHLVDAIHVSGIRAKYAERNRSTIPFYFVILKNILATFRDSLQDQSGIKLSQQDCLTAYFVAAINRCDPGAIRKITNTAQIPTEEIDSSRSTDIPYIAQLIRQSLQQGRAKEYIEGYMSTAGKYMAAAADEDKQFFFGSEAPVLSVNSTATYTDHRLTDITSIAWQSVDFGTGRPVNFYKTGVSRLYLRISAANPTGEYSFDEALDGCIGVPESFYHNFVKSLPLDGSKLCIT